MLRGIAATSASVTVGGVLGAPVVDSAWGTGVFSSIVFGLGSDIKPNYKNNTTHINFCNFILFFWRGSDVLHCVRREAIASSHTHLGDHCS